MEIKKKETPLEYLVLEFADTLDTLCRLWVLKSTHHLRFDLDFAFAQFSQEDIKTLLPYLQAFAETGQLEPPSVTSAKEHGSALLQRYSEAQEPTLQGGSLLEESIKKTASLIRQASEQEKRIDDLVETTARQNFNNYEQEKRIQALEQLVKEWSSCNWSVASARDLKKLQEKTSQLLGE